MRKFYWIFLMFIIGCASQKPKVSAEAIANLKTILETENIEFEAKNASPLRFSNDLNAYNHLPPGSNQNFINLSNISNHLKIYKDSVSIDLPFFGEQRMISSYTNNDNSFVFDQKLNEKTIQLIAKKGAYLMNLWVKGKREALRINYTLFANNSATVVVNSTNRNSITYRGSWQVIKEKNKE